MLLHDAQFSCISFLCGSSQLPTAFVWRFVVKCMLLVHTELFLEEPSTLALTKGMFACKAIELMCGIHCSQKLKFISMIWRN